MIEYIKGAVSPETAVVVDDYPYGFRLRCKIRYWLEYKRGHGFRFVSQTSNPKHPGLMWNKPKAGTYNNGPVILTRDIDSGHVSHIGLSFNSATLEQAESFLASHQDHLLESYIPELERFIAVKREYDKLMAAGEDYHTAATDATRRTLPASRLKAEVRANIIKRFGDDGHLMCSLDRGTIGEVEDQLKFYNLTFKNFRDDAFEEVK